jgi:MraZ protein
VVFIGTFENKVDRKGRVSVPATFRQMLASQSYNGIVAFRSYRADAIEACGMDFIEKLNEQISGYDFFSETQDDLATMIFAEALQLPFDGEGRIILPASQMEHAGITDRAAFVGKGRQFQIWQPEALEAQKAVALERARTQKLVVSMGDSGGAGK